MNNTVKTSNNLTKFLAENNKEEELMQEVFLIIEYLTNKEEATVKLIFDRLYDVGSVHLINKKFRSQPVNKILKFIARMSKPAFRIFAWHWVKKNCPLLITNWLHQQVTFSNKVVKNAEKIIEQKLPPADYISELDEQTREVKFLRSQVKLLTSVLIGVVTIFIGSLMWLSHNLTPGRSPLQNVEQLQRVTIQEASTATQK
ncbi:hypothetical protein [Fischerella thermalis]|uniref:hypothetical protein n=1 Tax=Fischerella thermalis TaxID=372787 RepID=UPI000C8010A7|nr:hypothetical protein [Fischerella thermalis]PLZ91893.1 hypothetical protein CI593_05770 [Fischerella thermalis CCMEE 5194]